MPTRLLIEIVAAIVIIASFAWYEQHRGAEKCIAADAKEVQKQEVHDAGVFGAQQAEVADSAKDFHEAANTPVVDAPVVRLCVQPRKERPVAAPAPAGPVDNGRAEHREPSSEVPASTEWDSYGVLQAAHVADAQIKALEEYAVTCQKR